jgi:hypothetical protein
MRFSLVLFLAVFMGFPLSAQSLRKKPDAVVVLKKMDYTVESLEKTTVHFVYRVIIFNPKGDKYGSIEIPFDNNTEIIDFKGGIYDTNGIKIKKIVKSDLVTVSDFADYSLYSDQKKKKATVHSSNYPYAVSYEYTLEMAGFLGTYWPLPDDYGLPARCVELSITSPKDIRINFRTNNFNGTIDTVDNGSTFTCIWRAHDIPAIRKEPSSPGFMELIPSVLISPEKFCYDGYCGSNESWVSYGKWVNTLLEEKEGLTPETVVKIHDLTDGIHDTLEKIKALYRYFQANTRYISVQIGIGGFQPTSSLTVDQYRYGDCKALSNYLRAMLAVIGVKALYTEIGNGPDRKIIWDDLPGVLQTNHVILTVPLCSDTLWLECTNNTLPFGYPGDGNCGRKAICITGSGAVIVNTPVYGSDVNRQVTNAVMTLNEDLSMQCEARISNSGVFMEELAYIKGLGRPEQEKLIAGKYPSTKMYIDDFTISENDEIFPEINFFIKLDDMGFISKTGDFYTFKPNYISREQNTLKSSECRENNIMLSPAFLELDTIRFIIPDGFVPEYLPLGKSIEGLFGKYKAECSINGNVLTYTRSFQVNHGNYAKEKYNDLNEFFNAVQVADNQNVIFKKQH